MSALAEVEREEDGQGSGPRRVLSAPTTTLASRRPALSSKLVRMPRWLRIVLSASCFGIFFGGSCLLGVLVGVFFRFSRVGPEGRAGFMRSLNARLVLFAELTRDLGLIDYWPPQLPPGYENRAFLLIANHPTLIDVVLTLSSIPQLSCVVKASWYRSFLLGPMLRQTEYVPGPGLETDEGDEAPVVRRIEEKLRSGVPVLVFPEGTRSAATKLRRFRRGAIEAARRAGVPILRLYIANDRRFLMKGVPFWHVPTQTCGYTFEWFEPIETEGLNVDSRTLTRQIAADYEARFAQHMEERQD